jgi:hypothetical protein
MILYTTFKLGFPKIRKNDNMYRFGGKIMKYKIGRDNYGWWSLAENIFMAIKIWFKYL